MQIKWHKNDSLYAEGRNGFMTMRGIDVEHNQGLGAVRLFPIHTRGIGRASMTVPQHAIPELIKALSAAMLRVEMPPDITLPKK